MTSESVQPVPGPNRRAVVAAAGAAGLAVALTACGSDDKASGSSTGQGATGGGATNEGGGASAGAGGGAALAKTADIPEGGGKIFKDEKVVVSQPAAGQYKAFSTICTHWNCPMVDLEGDTISCTCHGSRFSVLDGSVKKGPAVKPLEARQVTVDGDSITLA
ncbi:Rieske (2Fe-2S) protein [Streptomyces djakartensis]|uniref:Rieske (2Fe-2S) protein n=1 Tax=Streptomyces djakartensis TaxID=68193 RepID=UPI0034DF5CC9